MLWCERSDDGSDVEMDLGLNTVPSTADASTNIPPEIGDGTMDDWAAFDDPDIALAARIAVRTREN